MDLSYNTCPSFTRWVLRHSLLTTPLIVIDVGVQGGASVRWEHLSERVEVHGFDALEEAISPLRTEGKPGHHYYATALGNEDGERTLFIATEPTASSLYAHGSSRYDIGDNVKRSAGTRRVPIRRLDSFVSEGTITRADFIKIDAEGFEPEILKGAQALLSTGVLALEMETSFSSSPTVPLTHFGALHEQLLPHGFLVYDIAFSRIERASFANRARRLGISRPRTVPRPATVNALFYRDTPSLGAEETLKRAIILELYGLTDTAYDVLIANAATFADDFPLEEAADQLLLGGRLWEASRHTSVRVAVRDGIYAIGAAVRNSIDWRFRGRRSAP